MEAGQILVSSRSRPLLLLLSLTASILVNSRLQIDKKYHLDAMLLSQHMLEDWAFWFGFSDGGSSLDISTRRAVSVLTFPSTLQTRTSSDGPSSHCESGGLFRVGTSESEGSLLRLRAARSAV